MAQTAPICFVDTETTDVDHRRLAWELAVIRRNPDGTRKELQTHIEVNLSDANPYALEVGRFHERHPLGRWLASGMASHVANSLRDVPKPDRQNWRGGFDCTNGYVTQADAALLWCRWTHGCHIIGAVPSFDVEVMAAAARAAGLVPSHDHHLTCVSDLLAGWLRGQIQRVEAISGALGEPLPESTAEEVGGMREALVGSWNSRAFYEAAGLPPTPEGELHTALGDARAAERAWDLVMG